MLLSRVLSMRLNVRVPYNFACSVSFLIFMGAIVTTAAVFQCASFQTSKPSSSTTGTPQSTPAPQATPPPQSTPFPVPSIPATSATPSVNPGPSPVSVPLVNQPGSGAGTLTLDEALRLAAAQASSFQQASINERIAAEDVKQAQAAFLPKVSAPLSHIYTSPAIGLTAGEPRTQSFIANNAINEYQAFVNVSGDLDIAGKLRATRPKNLSASPRSF